MSVSELTLRPIASPVGVFSLLALDHRDAFRNAFRRAGVADVTAETMLETKCRIVGALAGEASGALLDPDATRLCRPAGLAILVPLEEQGHEQLDGGRLNRLLDDFGPEQAAELGADGCKLLLYYRPDHPATAARQRDLVAAAADACHRHGLPLVVEPLVYRLEEEGDAAYEAVFADVVVAASRELADSGADLLKLQFPGDLDACVRVTEAAAPLAWALLGGSNVDAATFARQLEAACRGGCSGFMAGRAIWGGALGLAPADQDHWLVRQARPLFRRLARIAHEHARGIQ